MKKCAGLLCIMLALLLTFALAGCKPAEEAPPVTSALTTADTAVQTTPPPVTTAQITEIKQFIWITEPTYTYDNIRPVFEDDIALYDFGMGHFDIQSERAAAFMKYAFYDADGGTGVLLPDGTVGLDAALDMRWCSLEGLVDGEHNYYNEKLEKVGASGHGYSLTLYDAEKGSLFIADAESPAYISDTSGISGIFRLCRVIPDTLLGFGYNIEYTGTYIIYYDGKAVTGTDVTDAHSQPGDGVYTYTTGDRWYFLDGKDGSRPVQGGFDAAYCFYEGLAAVCRNGKWGYIDKNGNTVIDYQFEEARSFSGGQAYVKSDGKWGIIGLAE